MGRDPVGWGRDSRVSTSTVRLFSQRVSLGTDYPGSCLQVVRLGLHRSVCVFTESSYLHSSTPLPLSAAPSSLAPLFQALQRVNFQLSARDREEQLLASGAGQGIWNLLLRQTYGQSLFQPQLCPHLQRYLVSSVPAPCPHFLLSSPLCRQ